MFIHMISIKEKDMTQSRFEAFGNRSIGLANAEEEVATTKISKPKNKLKKQNSDSFPVVPTKQITFSLAPTIRKILKELRIKNEPGQSDARYLSNLIYRDKFGENLYDENGKQMFEIDPETGEKK